MLNRLIDDVRMATGSAARQTFFVIAVAVSLFITTAFLCAAAFVFVLERFGLFQACLAGAAVFFVVTLINAASYYMLKRNAAKRLVEETKTATKGFAPDPMMLAAGLQVARAIGIKKLVPVLAIAGVVLGVMAARGQSSAEETSADE